MENEYENKAQFVMDFQRALVDNGAGRYDDLIANPFGCIERDGSTMVVLDGRCVDVTCDSLTSIAKEMCKLVC